VLLLLFFEFSERNFEFVGVRDVLNMSGRGVFQGVSSGSGVGGVWENNLSYLIQNRNGTTQQTFSR
jgi:hypothetical protein